MIQELLGGSSLIAGESKISSINGAAGVSPITITTPSPNSLSPSPSSSSSSSSPSSTTAAATTNSDNQNLRCPRCDSSNTKFCYYNNYNLTQPRHFCKTCRRYWTKGGALRNIPIGGGCRKNRNVGSVSNSVAKTGMGKVRSTVAACELERSVVGVGGFVEHVELPSSPILWGSPQNSRIMGLLRASQNQNPNPNPSAAAAPPMSVNGVCVKEEGRVVGAHTVTEAIVGNNGLVNVNGRAALGFDCVGQFPPLGLCSSIWRNNNNNNNNIEDGVLLGQHQSISTGIQELYQRLRSSSVNYCGDNNSQVFLGSMPPPSSSSLSILESAPVVAGDDQLGYTWNPTLSWSDIPTTNGTAYP